MKRIDNKGLTLVEVILAILILGICATMLALSFSGALRIVNRATLYKMESSTTSSSIELEEKQDAANDDYTIAKFDYEDAGSGLTLSYVKNGTSLNTTVKGQYIVASAEGNGNTTKLSYREFLSSNIGFNVNAEDAD